MLKDLPVFFIVFLGLLSVKRAVIHNEIETALEVLCSSKLNFKILEMNFQNERTVSMYLTKSNFTFSCSAPMKRYGRTMKKLMLRYLSSQTAPGRALSNPRFKSEA